MQTVTLSYKLKLYPTRNKAETLALLVALFQRAHAACTLVLRTQGRCLSAKGLGGFIGQAYRRAYIDYCRTTKSGQIPGILKADLIDAAYVQTPRKATAFDYWIKLRCVMPTRDNRTGFYVPAKGHRALRRTLALPGARLNQSAEVCRKNGKWYAHVSVTVPLPIVQAPQGWLGCDVGVRAAVTRSDGYRGPNLHPVLQRQKKRLASQQRNGCNRKSQPQQRHILAREARRAVLVAQRSGRGVVVEDPKRLIRWKGHAARYFGKRVLLLAAIVGICMQAINPAYSSSTCPRCGLVEPRMRHKGALRCWRCGYTANSDFSASRILAARAHGYCHSHQASRSLLLGGVSVDP